MSRGLGDVYKRQEQTRIFLINFLSRIEIKIDKYILLLLLLSLSLSLSLSLALSPSLSPSLSLSFYFFIFYFLGRIEIFFK